MGENDDIVGIVVSTVAKRGRLAVVIIVTDPFLGLEDRDILDQAGPGDNSQHLHTAAQAQDGNIL